MDALLDVFPAPHLMSMFSEYFQVDAAETLLRFDLSSSSSC